MLIATFCRFVTRKVLDACSFMENGTLLTTPRCENDGNCVNGSDSPGSFSCVCSLGFTGPRCQEGMNAFTKTSNSKRYLYTPRVKKQDTWFLPTTSENIDRFSKLFHRQTQQWLRNELILKIHHTLKASLHYLVKLQCSKIDRTCTLINTSYRLPIMSL